MSEPGAAADAEQGSATRTSPVVTWLVGGAILVVGAALILLSEPVPEPLSPGQEAPAFELPVLGADATVSLARERGRVVLINFWATWCKPCEDEMPAMERLYRTLQPLGFELLAVSVDQDAEPVVAFRDRLGLTFPIALDSDGMVSARYQTTGYPESILVDADGRVAERYIGPRDWDDRIYQQRIRGLLASAAGPGAGGS